MTNSPTKQLELSGSCLCGDKTYRASGEVFGFFHCYCGRCRKASGTGNASLVILMPGELEIFGDAQDIGWYKVPEAVRFGNRFCKTCGGPLPRIAEETKRVVIQAGTLDEEPGLTPDCRIFYGSRASWSCENSELPAFDQYPE